jgi:hypothetical protein
MGLQLWSRQSCCESELEKRSYDEKEWTYLIVCGREARQDLINWVCNEGDSDDLFVLHITEVEQNTALDIFVQNSLSDEMQMQHSGLRGKRVWLELFRHKILLKESHLYPGKWGFTTRYKKNLAFHSKLFFTFTGNLSFPCLTTMTSTLSHRMNLSPRDPALIKKGLPLFHLRR